jgi:hypothetical protein
VLIAGFVFNFAWEMAQSYLYESMGTAWEATRRCFVASIGDAVMVLGVLTVVRVVAHRGSAARQRALTALAGGAVAVIVEWWGLSQGRWAYLPAMPTFPGTELGVVPLLQLTLLAPLTMAAADWLTVGRSVHLRS